MSLNKTHQESNIITVFIKAMVQTLLQLNLPLQSN